MYVYNRTLRKVGYSSVFQRQPVDCHPTFTIICPVIVCADAMRHSCGVLEPAWRPLRIAISCTRRLQRCEARQQSWIDPSWSAPWT
jgi:hypothetical protein